MFTVDENTIVGKIYPDKAESGTFKKYGIILFGILCVLAYFALMACI